MEASASNEDVGTFVSVTACSGEVAIAFLNRYHELGKAMDAYFQNNGALPLEHQWDSQSQWDETQFHSGRTYGPENRPQNSFQVHSTDPMDSLGPNLFNTTLSRPPSRVSNKFEDSATQEQRDLQEALSMSMSQTLPGQESGVTEGGNFRPAQKDHYDPHQWGMTVTNARQVIPNPEPEFRRKLQNAPAFLKPSMQEDYLPALLTILHQVPMAREALLLRESVIQDYGWGEEWWDGEPIRVKHVTAFDDGSHIAQSRTDDILAETQRLMAFLELTERAYGNVSVLGRVSEGGDDRDTCITERYLATWAERVSDKLSDYPLQHIFETRAFSRTPDSHGDEADATVRVIKLYLNSSAPGEDLYEALDGVLWGSWTPDIPSVPYLSFGEIVVFQREQTVTFPKGQSPALNAPISWYADRYLAENVPKAKDMLENRYQIASEINTVSELQKKLRVIPTSDSNNSIDAQNLLQVIKPFFAGEYLIESDIDDEERAILSGQHYHPLEIYKRISEQLQEIAERVMLKHQALEETKEKLQKSLMDASGFLKSPSSTNGDDGPKHRYTLRGAVVDPRTIYVLANPNSVEDLIDSNPEDWQWWKIGFAPDDYSPISWERVEEHQVLDATKNSTDLMLVYASDKAVAYERQPLPEPLRNFVRGDNLLFEQEQEKAKIQGSSANHQTDQWTGDSWDDPVPITSGRVPDSPTSVIVQADDEYDNAYAVEPPMLLFESKPSIPPPVPPRSPNKRRTPPRPPVGSSQGHTENLIDAEPEGQSNPNLPFQAIDEMEEIDPQCTTLGVVPGGPTSGISEAANGEYADSIRMSDFEDNSDEPGAMNKKDSKVGKAGEDDFETVSLI